MKTSKILLGGIAGGVTFFFLGWLIYGILLMDYSVENYNQCAARSMEDMKWWALIVANLANGFILAFVFSWANIKGILVGAIAGGVIGVLMSISMDLSNYSMSTTFANHTAVCVDIIAFTIMSIISGIAVSLVMNIGKKEVK